jgi:hypothetical protein
VTKFAAGNSASANFEHLFVSICFFKFSQAKTYDRVVARWRLDAEASHPGLLPALIDWRGFAVEQDRQRLSRANRGADIDR